MPLSLREKGLCNVKCFETFFGLARATVQNCQKSIKRSKAGAIKIVDRAGARAGNNETADAVGKKSKIHLRFHGLGASTTPSSSLSGNGFHSLQMLFRQMTRNSVEAQ